MKFREIDRESDDRPRVKLKDKESITGVFRGDIHEYYQHWVGDKSELCPGKEKCQMCKAGAKPQFRFRLNFVTKEGAGYVAKIFEQGWTVYTQLGALDAAIKGNGGDLEKTLVSISRSGSGKNDTTYTIIVLPKAVGDLSKVALLKLEDEPHADGPRDKTMAPAVSEDDIPF